MRSLFYLFLFAIPAFAQPSCKALLTLLQEPIQDFRAPKPRTFPKVDPIGNAAFFSELELLATVSQPKVRNQALCGCVPNAFAALLDVYARHIGYSAPLSANYITARRLEEKARDVMRVGGPDFVDEGDYLESVQECAESYGIVDQAVYPDSSDIDTIALSDKLTELAETFREVKHLRLAKGRQLNHYAAATHRKIRSLVEATFGTYPQVEQAQALGNLFFQSSTWIERDLEPGARQKDLLHFFKILFHRGVGILVDYRHLPYFFDAKTGSYRSLQSGALSHDEKLNAGAHAVLAVGLARHRRTSELFLVLQNSHGIPATLFMPLSYFRETGRTVAALVPDSLQVKFE